MADPSSPQDKALEAMLGEMRAQRGRIEGLIQQFQQRIDQAEAARRSGSNPPSGAHWRLVAFKDSLDRLRLFLEQNLKEPESFGLLSVTRYILELTVWLKLLKMDERYGFIYYRELLEKQRDFYEQFKKNAQREISFLRDTSDRERSLIEARLSDKTRGGDERAREEELPRIIKEVAELTDREAARNFSLYAEQARTNGYDFQAYLVETKVLPEYSRVIAAIKQKLDDFQLDTPPGAAELVTKQWNWKDMAKRVGMGDEYDFIYRYASRLLHATPASLTTDQRNLQTNEIRMFLGYVRVRLLDALDMAKQLLIADSTLVN
ncbi:MAG: hypothetical protein KGL59_15095 [Acidobacteriota bacterium]|nr:hypothetical protein [Acidobacteriota bacterium]